MKRDELLVYYERELRFIRKLASGFAEKYPEVAGRLLLEPTKCEDPHVERLIESFAMLTARVHQRLDDDFSSVTDALMGILYPHFLRPIPSMTIVQMTVDPDVGSVEGGFSVDAGSLLHSRSVGGVRCSFRTAYSVDLFPIEVRGIEIVSTTPLRDLVPERTRSALRIRLETVGGVPFSELGVDRLRFFLDASSGDIHSLYELFLRDPQGLVVRADDASPAHYLPPESIRPVGFGRDEGLLQYPAEAFLGYRLLQEYFAFPDKFLFVEISDLLSSSRSCPGNRLDLLVLLTQTPAQLDLRVDPENLKLGCTPAVNLFPRAADPIRMTHTSVEYAVSPDARSPDAYEVYSIDRLTSLVPGSSQVVEFQPFYGLRHGQAGADSRSAYWHAVRRPSMRKGDAGSDVFISLVDPDFDPLAAPVDVLQVETTCTNRGLPARLPFGSPRGDFQLEGRPGVSKIVALRKPTEPMEAPMAGGNRWRLISHLSLNYLSILGSGAVDSSTPEEGEWNAVDALREILRLYDFRDSAVTRQRIAGLVGLRTRRVVRRVGSGVSAGFARGLEVELEFDPTQYTGAGVFLFASVLERFLGLYTTVNSFTQTVAKVRQQPGALKRWPARAGDMQLL